MRALVLLLIALASCRTAAETAEAPPADAAAWLRRSLDYHDPDGRWDAEPLFLHWVSTRPGGETAYTFDLALGPGGDFAMQGRRYEWELEYAVRDGEAHSRVLDVDEVTPEMESRLLLARDDGLFWRDYMGFLAGLPMVLAYDGVALEPEVTRTEFEGRPVTAVRASFDPAVGTDRWTFYFDPESAALVGCRFDKADPEQEGETIVFEGETTAGGVRLPRTRRWYVNSDGRFLGTDEVTAGR